MVKIAKVKPKPKSKKTVTVMKTMPRIIPLPFLEDEPEGPRRSQKRTVMPMMGSRWFIKSSKYSQN